MSEYPTKQRCPQCDKDSRCGHPYHGVTFTQAEVDALVATAYEDAAEVCRKILSRSWKVDAAGSDVLVEEDGTVVDSDVSPVTAIRSRTPGDAQKALAEHDAALREKWDSECFPNQWINAKVEVRDKAIAKLEAECLRLGNLYNDTENKRAKLETENAKLYSTLLMYVDDHYHMNQDRNCQCKVCGDARALLAKSGAEGG